MIQIMFKGGVELLIDHKWEPVDALMRDPISKKLVVKPKDKHYLMRIGHHFIYIEDILWIKEIK